MSEARRWSGKRVVILGAARQGLALARYLVWQGASVVLSDQRKWEDLAEARTALADLEATRPGALEWVCGGHPLEMLDGADLVCPSGGVPLDQPVVTLALQKGIPLSNDSQIFLEVTPAKVIGITGSAGKTTTTSLVGRMAQAAARGIQAQAWTGGNIGSPLISVVDQMKAGDLAVMELSSFQLEIMTRSPQVAAVLNITPNHLDRHSSMQAYTAAKARILAYQSGGEVAVLGRDDPGAWGLKDSVRGKLVGFGIQQARVLPGTYLKNETLILWDGMAETALMEQSTVGLRGQHNLLNVLAACAVAHAAGFPVEAMRAGVVGFAGVPHRLEFVRTWGGASWYNDSIATAPERSMAAIRSFDEPLVLLAGGRDKNLPWDDFAQLVRQRVQHVILFGEAAQKIATALAPGKAVTVCGNLEQAVTAAAGLAKPGDVVLLSPGGTSFDEFKDFEERGECFRRLVMQL
jgi:UDP-N-acetylmuramoylalanine--D-glutamate ligase